MNIKTYWNKVSPIKRMELAKQLQITRDLRRIVLLEWDALYPIEQKQLKEVYTHKQFTITFNLKCNEFGSYEVIREIKKFMESKTWSYNNLTIKYGE